MQVTWIVEPITSHVYGEYGAVANLPYRIEIAQNETRCFKHDKRVAWESMPKYMQKAAAAFVDMIVASLKARAV